MPLKVTLKPGEKFVINGAVVVNGDRRANLLIQNKVSILREKDVLLPEDATTPVRRIYFASMMMYLDDKAHKTYYDEFVERTTEFINAISNKGALERCINIIEDVNQKQHYRALMTCKKLLPFEQERLKYGEGETEEGKPAEAAAKAGA